MSQYSLPWNSTGGGHVGTGPSGAYTSAEMRRAFRAMFGNGVFRRTETEFSGQFACSVPSNNNISVATGSACVDGFIAMNDTAVTLPVSSPASSTGGRVIIRVDWTAQTATLVVKLNTVGNTVAPALTQTDGTTWEMSLASFVITSGGVITLTDTRAFVAFSNPSNITIGQRRGGSSSDPTTPGATNYDWLTGLKIQTGVASASFSGTNTHFYNTVTFPEAFSSKPLVFLQVATEILTADGPISGTVDRGNVTTSQFEVHMQRDAGNTSGLTVAYNWLALGAP